MLNTTPQPLPEFLNVEPEQLITPLPFVPKIKQELSNKLPVLPVLITFRLFILQDVTTELAADNALVNPLLLSVYVCPLPLIFTPF